MDALRNRERIFEVAKGPLRAMARMPVWRVSEPVPCIAIALHEMR